MSVHSPFRFRHVGELPAPREPDAPRSDPGPAPPAAAGQGAPGRSDVRLGPVRMGSAARYLALWTLVLMGVEVLVFWVGYLLLASLGVLESVSAAAATVLGDPVPESGVLPALELAALLPWAVLAGAALALLWLVLTLSLLLVHNGICRIVGGPRICLR